MERYFITNTEVGAYGEIYKKEEKNGSLNYYLKDSYIKYENVTFLISYFSPLTYYLGLLKYYLNYSEQARKSYRFPRCSFSPYEFQIL